MEDRTYQKTVAVIIVLVILGIAAYGSFLPMRKSQFFIATLQSLQQQPPTSVDDLKQRISPPLDYPSPVGQEELVRNVGNSVLGFVQSSHDKASIDLFLGFLDGYYKPIVDRGKGMSFGQDLYILGAAHELAFANTGEPAYLELSRKYFEEAVALGPNRPQGLYGLLDVTRIMGDVTTTLQTAQTILTNWPTDERVQQAVQAFIASMKNATRTTSTAPKPAK